MPKPKLPFKNFEWTPQLAYAVGLLVTDGCLSKDGRHIIMRSAEPALLETFKECLNLKNKTGYTDGQRGYRVQFGNVQFYNWLISIGLFPAKTHIIGGIKIPDEFFRDFLRGHLDGDGSICGYEDRYNVYRDRIYTNQRIFVRYISVSEKHIRWLHNKIQQLAGVKGALIFTKSRRINTVPMWTIKFAKKESLKLLDWIYYQPNLPTLLRKRLLAERLTRRIKNEVRKPYAFVVK
ncbi:MAG: Intein-containing protein [Parcubacteria group bacterium GW2011_GWA1_59_11]|nr:MAG: Intein-containing protein [Parcubacteria group bacterium GW2011_GWA1_59_11]